MVVWCWIIDDAVVHDDVKWVSMSWPIGNSFGADKEFKLSIDSEMEGEIVAWNRRQFATTNQFSMGSTNPSRWIQSRFLATEIKQWIPRKRGRLPINRQLSTATNSELIDLFGLDETLLAGHDNSCASSGVIELMADVDNGPVALHY